MKPSTCHGKTEMATLYYGCVFNINFLPSNSVVVVGSFIVLVDIVEMEPAGMVDLLSLVVIV